ncbi:hypothetical protein LOCC1_G005760 [Lachnellula occidentalis]|uniref:Putative gamma-glutamylcyclotransferase n=1 Tax=Lachnellula occidentalis TaxID=215460 RepID=A0A8H8S297_9HELO|nr:hypothetical protein LOCC1_G005760 [Lachnellula occidentalis]
MEPNNDETKHPLTNKNRPSAEEADPMDTDQMLSLTNRNFPSGRAFEPPPDRENSHGFRPQYFFFYGSLIDARQLRKILQLQKTPVLQCASIVGWDIMLWGQYPALIFKADTVTYGMAYEVQKEEHVEYLMRYETDAYRVNGCEIKLADGREVGGKTFVWNAGKELLKEGSFDLKDWQMEQLEK